MECAADLISFVFSAQTNSSSGTAALQRICSRSAWSTFLSRDTRHTQTTMQAMWISEMPKFRNLSIALCYSHRNWKGQQKFPLWKTCFSQEKSLIKKYMTAELPLPGQWVLPQLLSYYTHHLTQVWIVVHHHEPECCVTILDCCAHSQGHGDGSNLQRMSSKRVRLQGWYLAAPGGKPCFFCLISCHPRLLVFSSII